MRLKNKKVAVIGFGLTGRAVVDFLLKKEANITVFDESKRCKFESDIACLEKKGVRFDFGLFDFEKIAEAELFVTSPGISKFKFPQFEKIKENGKDVISEIELAFIFLKGKLIAITGTNGKSTTASLVHHLFRAAGRKSYLLGNIGIPFISEVENIGTDEYAVVEVSCFQLEQIKLFKPDYVILTNISEDHLDRYPSIESYIETRKNIFKNITSEDKIILNFDDSLTRKHFSYLSTGEIYPIRSNPKEQEALPVTGTSDGVYWFSRKSKISRGTFLIDGNFIFRDREEELIFFKSSELPLIGLHNIENALAASIPLILEGTETDIIKIGLKSFKGLKHRMEFVTSICRVDFINDSKATNVDAVFKASSSLNSASGQIVIIMGGKDKGGDFSLLKPVLNDKIKLLVLIGEDASRIRAQLKGVVPIKKVACMEEAVRLSLRRQNPGAWSCYLRGAPVLICLKNLSIGERFLEKR